MALRTRPPTGRPAWPLILLEGEEKAGKTTQALLLSASPRVGRTFVWDLGDGCADEYAALGPYEVVEFGGTYRGLVDSLVEATALPPTDGKPNVFVLDSGTDLWDSEKVRADTRARGSKRALAILKDDPDAEIDTSMTYWNDAKSRWARVVQILRQANGISIITAQGREVSKVQNGAPVAGQTEWSIQAEKTITSAAKAWVRVHRSPRRVELIGVHRIGLDQDPSKIALPLDRALDALVFDVIGIEGKEFSANTGTQITPGIDVPKAKQRLLVAYKGLGLGDREAASAASEAWRAAGLADLTKDDEVEPSTLAELLASVDRPPEGPGDDPGPDAAPTPPEADTDDQGSVSEAQEPSAPPESPPPDDEGDVYDFDVAGSTIAQVVLWVAGDRGRAEFARAIEAARSKPRRGLLASLAVSAEPEASRPETAADVIADDPDPGPIVEDVEAEETTLARLAARPTSELSRDDLLEFLCLVDVELGRDFDEAFAEYQAKSNPMLRGEAQAARARLAAHT